MTTACLDLSNNPDGSALGRLTPDKQAWMAAHIDPESCVLHLDEACLDEVAAMAEQIGRQRLPTHVHRPDQFAIPNLRRVMAEAKHLLDSTPGIAVIDTLPVQQLDEDVSTAVFWVLGQLIGRPVAQKWDGTILYHVRDTGQSYGYGVRGSYTNVELGFHNDNAFGEVLPDYVGLLCLQPAVEGGVSRFCNVHSLHQRMQGADPKLLARLYQPFLWDRQAEHEDGAPRVARAPVFSRDGDRLSARMNVSLVHKGYEIAGEEMDQEAAEALAALAAVVAEPEFRIDLPLERGQLQYLNNRDVVHFRSRFTDSPEPSLKRRLIRTWHRDWGEPGYDG